MDTVEIMRLRSRIHPPDKSLRRLATIIMKHFFTTLACLAFVTLPAAATQSLPPGVAMASSQLEESTLDGTLLTGNNPVRQITPLANETATYTEWEDAGMASWDQYTWQAWTSLGITGENHFKVEKRAMIGNPDIIQVKLVGVFNGSDFIIDGNASSYECSSTRQPTNIETSVFTADAELTYFDAGIIPDKQSSMSMAGGRMYFNLALYHLNTSDRYISKGSCMVIFDNAARFSYEVEGRHVWGKDEATATIDIKPSGDVKQFRYIMSYDNLGYSPTDAFTTYADQLQTATTSITVPLKTGCWSLYIYPCDAEGRWLGFESNDMYIWSYRSHSIHSNAADDYEWVDYGTATVNEGVCNDFYFDPDLPRAFECKVLTRKDAPGKFLRLVNPYGPTSTVGSILLKKSDWRFQLPGEDFYIDINMENPDKTYLYDRPIGLEKHVDYSVNDPWQPLGTYIYGTHRQIMAGAPEDKIVYATNRWNRLTFGQYRTLEIELAADLKLADNALGSDMTLVLEAEDGVDYVKYAFVNDENGMETADKIAAGDASVTVYTANVNGSRAAGRTITVRIPDNITEAKRLIAVPYNAQNELTGTYLDSEIELWHSIGTATISGALNSLGGMKPEVATEQFGLSTKFRLVNPANNDSGDKYFYIDATDAENVNFSSDGKSADYHTGYFLSGYSQTISPYINTMHNLVNNNVLSATEYTMPVLTDRTVTADTYSMAILLYSSDNSQLNPYYLGESTITLPEWNKPAAIENIAPEINDENAPVEYFNLQGVKISEPGPGLYIRRQGSKAEKILIK